MASGNEKVDVLGVIGRAASGREWDMNRAAAANDLDAATSAERESRELREARAAVAELIEAAKTLDRALGAGGYSAKGRYRGPLRAVLARIHQEGNSRDQ